jgi:hypothetical protein
VLIFLQRQLLFGLRWDDVNESGWPDADYGLGIKPAEVTLLQQHICGRYESGA